MFIPVIIPGPIIVNRRIRHLALIRSIGCVGRREDSKSWNEGVLLLEEGRIDAVPSCKWRIQGKEGLAGSSPWGRGERLPGSWRWDYWPLFGSLPDHISFWFGLGIGIRLVVVTAPHPQQQQQHPRGTLVACETTDVFNTFGGNYICGHSIRHLLDA